MTRDRQKDFEREAITSLLQRLNIKEEFEFLKPPEPDFLLYLKHVRVGLEITGYYSSPKRKQFEEAWLVIEKSLYTIDLVERGLPRLSVNLSFLKLLVPTPKETEDFIEELISFLKQLRGEITTEHNFFYVQNQQYPLLKKYIRRIAVRKIDNFSMWRCTEITMGWVGLSEKNILQIIRKKQKLARNYKGLYNKLWLMIAAGEGENISSQMGHMFHYQLPA